MSEGKDNTAFEDETAKSDSMELGRLDETHSDGNATVDDSSGNSNNKGRGATEADVAGSSPSPNDRETLIGDADTGRARVQVTRPTVTVIPVKRRADMEIKWDRSPYTYKGLQAAEYSWTGALPTPASPRSPTGLHLQEPANHGAGSGRGDTPVNVPPIGHFGDFYSPEEMGLDDFGSDSDSDDAGVSKTYEEDTIGLNEANTLFGQFKSIVSPAVMDPTSKMDRQQIMNGVKLADRIGKVPLSKAWHLFSEFFAIAVFVANVVVGIYDIAREAEHLHYKVSAVVFGVLENAILIIMWVIARHPRMKRRDDYQTHLKRMQYAENVTAEIFMYVTIIITLFGFATEKMYQTPDDAFGWTQLVLLAFDVLAILYTNVLRMYMLYKLMKDIIQVIYPDDTCDGKYMLGKSSFAGYLMPRAHLTMVGNVCLLLAMGAMLGVQVWEDNYEDEDYHATHESAFLLILLVLIPILGNVLFVLVNMYWVMELLITLSVAVGKDAEHMRQLGQEHGEVVAGTIEFAQNKVNASQEKLAELRGAKTWQKLLYGVSEVYILFLVFFYAVMTFLALFFFDGFSQDWANYLLKSLFVILLIIGNGHLLLLMLLSNFAILIFIVSVIFYPLAIPCCCRKNNNVADGFNKLKIKK